MATQETIKVSQMTEITTINGEEYLMVIQDGDNKKIKTKAIRGADNLAENSITLKSIDDDSEYRMVLNSDGTQQIYPVDAFTGNDAVPAFDAYSGLIINQIYGGGTGAGEIGPVSHSFIELYNDTDRDINLKGMYLFYCTIENTWQKLALRGYIKQKHSFLIRGNLAVDIKNVLSDAVRCKIDKYDQEWPIDMASTGFIAFLAIGSKNPTGDELKRQYTNTGTGATTKVDRFIDAMACNGRNNTQSRIPYYTELTVRSFLDKNTACRKIDSGFVSNTKRTFDCFKSVQEIDYSTCNVSMYRPRCSEDGIWDYYITRLKLNENVPNLIDIYFGENGNNTRTFTWQSRVTTEGYLRYRMIKDATGNVVTNDWTKVETTREMVKHHDQDCTIHRVIIKNLAYGEYEYQAGEEGFWSDIETFKVKEFTDETPIKVLWTTDQQGWTEDEYRVWKTCIESIAYHDKTDYDWHLNTGDVSQNASRSFEWRYYFKHSGKYTRNMPHMITCGNNDLIDKKYGTAYEYYSTAENQPMINDYFTSVKSPTNRKIVSTHAWDLGYVHFVCVNSNEEQMYEGVGVNAFIKKECEWLEAHLTEVEARETKPRWVIVYMHLSPFTCVRTPRVQPFVPIFEKHKVDLVLCGHNHTYTRSKCLRTGFDGVPYKSMSYGGGDNGGTGATYNTYYNFPSKKAVPVLDEEYVSIGSTTPINRKEDTVNGTYYVMCGATGYKLTGKETGIDFNNIAVLSDLKGTKHDNGKGYPWWYEVWGGVMETPMYANLEITKDHILMKAYKVPGTIVTDRTTKLTVVNNFDYNNPDKFKPVEMDSLEIRYQDARHTK